MIATVDVHYLGKTAITAGITFDNWNDQDALHCYVTKTSHFGFYEPGNFYKRELPCIKSLMAQHNLTPDILIIDGYVYLDGFLKPGLGKHLYDYLKRRIPIIGVAKNRFEGIADNFTLIRGKSNKPLYITSVGISTLEAKRKIAEMHGEHRIPTLLKKVDQLSRKI